MADAKKPVQATKSDEKVEGEGSYSATRGYEQGMSQFMREHGNDVVDMAKDAEKALDGEEGDELRRAEEEGKSHARPGGQK